MLKPQPTASERSCPDPHRWSRAEVSAALDKFSNPNHPSQRQHAQQQGIPHATFNYWVRRYTPAADDPVAAFFHSSAGESALRRIVLAAMTIFQIQGACGIRLVSDFLERSELNRFVASSRGALQPLAAHIESDLVAFRDSEHPVLAQQMAPKTITLVPDEHFHSGRPCLVGLEPVANFILVECYREHRDATTWKGAIQEGTKGIPVEIVQMTVHPGFQWVDFYDEIPIPSGKQRKSRGFLSIFRGPQKEKTRHGSNALEWNNGRLLPLRRNEKPIHLPRV